MSIVDTAENIVKLFHYLVAPYSDADEYGGEISTGLNTGAIYLSYDRSRTQGTQ